MWKSATSHELKVRAISHVLEPDSHSTENCVVVELQDQPISQSALTLPMEASAALDVRKASSDCKRAGSEHVSEALRYLGRRPAGSRSRKPLFRQSGSGHRRHTAEGLKDRSGQQS